MAIEERLEQISVDAGATLAAADQFKAVKLNSNGQAVLVTAITDLPIGILQDVAIAGRAVPVAVGGIVKAKAGGTIPAGSQVAVKADGTLQVAVATQYVIGTSRWSAANGDIFSVHLQPAVVKA